MRTRLGAAVTTLVLVGSALGCGADAPASDGSQTTGSPTTVVIYDMPQPVAVPAVGLVTSTGAVPLEGRLEGLLDGLSFASPTSVNDAWVEEFEGVGGARRLASLSIATETAGGAGMMILTVEAPADHALFGGQGPVSLESTAQAQALSPVEPSIGPSVVVRSCSGPAVGVYPVEGYAEEFEITAEPIADAPSALRWTVTAEFPAGSDTSTLVGTFTLPNALAPLAE